MRDLLTIFYDADEAGGGGEGGGEVSLERTGGEGGGTEGTPEAKDTGNAAFDWSSEANAAFASTALPEGITIAGREVTGTVQEAFEAAEKRIKGFLGKAPESYEVKPETFFAAEANAEAIKPMLDQMKGAGLNQEQADVVMGMFDDISTAMTEVATKAGQVDLMNEWGITGEAFEARYSEVNEWANENLPDDVFDALASTGNAGVKAAYAMMKENRENPTWKPGGGNKMADGEMSQDQVTEIMQSKAYLDPTAEGHADARAKVRAHFLATTPNATEVVSRGKHQRAG